MVFILGALLIISLIWMMIRRASSAATSSSISVSIARMKRNPKRAQAYADLLDIPIERKENVPAEDARLLIQKLANARTIKSFTVLHAQPMDEDHVLLFTTVKYSDLEVVPGRGGMVPIDVTRTAHHEFLVQYIPATANFTVNSDLYSTSNERLQKNEFTRYVIQLLTAVTA